MKPCLALALLFALALPHNTATAQQDTALAAFNAQDYGAARQAFASRAENGDAAAQFYLGILYLRGYGVERNPGAARDWLTRAANANHVPAQFHLAELHRHGTGVAADAGKAAHWYERAAEGGWFGAQMALAKLYATGDGVRRDPVAAHKWYDIAAEMGLDPYNADRDALANTMTEDELTEARRRAHAWIASHRRWDNASIAATAATAIRN